MVWLCFCHNSFAQAGDVYYFIPSSGDANTLSNWNTKPDGTGTAPTSLYSSNHFFVINNGKSATLSGSFGANGVYIFVGDETGGSLSSGTSGTLTTLAGTPYLQAIINVNKNSTLNFRMLNGATQYPVLRSLDPTSTVVYTGTASQNVLPANYGNLTINNSAGVVLPATISVAGTLSSTSGTINTTTNNANITFNGIAPQTIPGNTVYTGGTVQQITINNDSGVVLTNGATLTIMDSLIVNSGVFTLGTGSNTIIKGKAYVPTTHIADSTYKPGYTLVWHDEFTGAANTFPNPVYWAQHYTDTALARDTFQGQVFLSKILKSYNYLDGNGHYIAEVNDSGGIYYSGGSIATSWPYNVMKQYGYMECKTTFTPNNGVNCAFWLQSPTIGNNPPANDPATYGAEIDVCEYLGPSTTAPQGQVNSTLHKNGYSAPYHQQVTHAYPVSNPGWHILAVEWSPTYYKFYTDGVLTWTLTDTGFISKHPEFILVGNGIGWTPPNQAGNTWPALMQVDYVRVYNKN
ncbi:concanavalin A-like lectin/glucanase domain-containing protein [Russula earlei]|uniref:Concanavalin A-like lectin/glucanase domain-containing protein n=1 Tax=Russula earlei TaxID=71964 RepID=A0ACC0TRU4_9AGAM|nr:concanavalin A-like lectin/glucanase domain-containing protein [Russula earlei]